MAATLVLALSTEASMLCRSQRHGLHVEKRLSAGEDGIAEFRELLGKHRGALVHVVTDLAGEDFHEEQIPFLRGSERDIVIERRLAQRYRDARFTAALSLGDASAERRNERLLLAALPQAARLADWVAAASAPPATLASIQSAGLLAPALAAGLHLGRADLLLVTVNRAGLRQSFLEDGRLRLSRLRPASSEEMTPAFVRQEVERMLQFFESSRGLAGKQGLLQVAVVVADENLARFETALENDERLAFRTIGIRAAARKLGLRQIEPEPTADSLYLYLAARKPPKEQFLRGADRRPLLAWRARCAMAATAASILAACCAYGIWAGVEDQAVRAELASVRQEVAQLHAEQRQLRAQFPQSPTSADSVRAAALEFRRIAARAASPAKALSHLSSALGQAPEIELDALAWEVTDSSTEILEISGRVASAENTDLRTVGKHVARLAHLLSSVPQWKVAATRLPFDAAPQNAVAGDFGIRDAGERARFSLTLSRAP